MSTITDPGFKIRLRSKKKPERSVNVPQFSFSLVKVTDTRYSVLRDGEEIGYVFVRVENHNGQFWVGKMAGYTTRCHSSKNRAAESLAIRHYGLAMPELAGVPRPRKKAAAASAPTRRAVPALGSQGSLFNFKAQ